MKTDDEEITFKTFSKRDRIHLRVGFWVGAITCLIFNELLRYIFTHLL